VWIESSANPIVADGECVGYLAVQRDITARRATEQALRDSEARYRTLAEAAEDLIFIVNRDGMIDYANAATLERFGLQGRDVVGRTLHDVLPADTADHIWRAMWQVFETGQRDAFERRFDTAAGEIWLESWLVPMGGPGGISGVMAVARDIAGRKRLEQQYVQSQKMEAIGRLAGGIAHDFNNILTVILGYSEQLQDRFCRDSEEFADIDQVRKAGERASRLTRQLLAFSRQQVLAPKVLDLNEVVKELQRLLGRIIGEDVRLEVDAHARLDWTKVDPGQMEQLLLNLAVNARDAMPHGGRLTISTANATIDDLFARDHEGAHPGDYVKLSVADTGCGMTADVLAHAFEPFFTTKPEGKGTGLGLATVFGVVKQSGGFLTIDSSPGRGTTITAWLPVSHDAIEPAAPPVPTRTNGNETILLVEDEENIRRLMGWTLERRGYTVLAAETAAEALQLAHTWTGEIDLLLSDVVMPEVSGPDLARRMVRLKPDLRVLYVSGYPNRIVADDMVGSNAAFLAKPFAPHALATMVRACLDVPC
jgi:two-component system, cell cycle sensor histidine kinase and response regulator CckA